MSTPFDPEESLIYIQAFVYGPDGLTGSVLDLALALDTGASSTMLSWTLSRRLGYTASTDSESVEITTGSGIERALEIVVSNFSALGQERDNFLVLAHDLPPSTGVDGVLGLDFFRGQNLNIDFRNGLITLS